MGVSGGSVIHSVVLVDNKSERNAIDKSTFLGSGRRPKCGLLPVFGVLFGCASGFG